MRTLLLWVAAGAATCCLSCRPSANVPDATITIDVAHPGPVLSPTMYGIFFEDINHAADGGLYAEMIQNRDFEYDRVPEGMAWVDDSTIVNPQGWKERYRKPGALYAWSLVQEGGATGRITVDDGRPLHAENPHSLRLEVTNAAGGRIGVANDGYWGVGIRKNARYLVSFYARKDARFDGALTARLESRAGEVYAEQRITGIGREWKRFTGVLTSAAGDSSARFVLSAGCVGTVWLDVVSLFPEDTYNGRPKGVRNDLGRMLAAMHPSFLRFPGGCVVEGATLANRFPWKRTIGDIAARPGHWNLWGYHATDGLGFHEFLQLCEDLGAAPLYVVNVGMSCQGRGGEVADKAGIQAHLQEALDALEYAMGPVTSHWGAQRAANGHPEPFAMKYVEIGNENTGPDYRTAYKVIQAGIKKRYPEVITIAGHPFSLTDERMRPLPGVDIEMIDDHFYDSPDFFYEQSTRYDTFDRSNPWKVYVGEFAVTAGKVGLGNLRAALAESAFMIGMERNADVVTMASYAPTFVNVHNRAWTVDMIAYDGRRCYGTPSYHAITMFSTSRPDRTLPTTVAVRDIPTVSTDNLRGGIALRVFNGTAAFKDVRVTSTGGDLQTADRSQHLEAWRMDQGAWIVEGEALVDAATVQESILSAGDSTWKDYTVSLKAKKIDTRDGFAIDFLVNGKNRCIWQLGAWNNVADLLWQERNGTRVDAGRFLERRIDAGRWYDLRIEVKDGRVRCFIDGAMVRDEQLRGLFTPSLYATSGVRTTGGDVIIKIVNPHGSERSCRIELHGAGAVQPEGEVSVLTSASQDDENTFDQPERVAQRTVPLKGLGPVFEHVCPPSSLSILKLKVMR